jgi:hypothetical protein
LLPSPAVAGLHRLPARRRRLRASFGGLAALLAMLNSCAAGVALVNLDNGFGAGCLAALLNRKD